MKWQRKERALDDAAVHFQQHYLLNDIIAMTTTCDGASTLPRWPEGTISFAPTIERNLDCWSFTTSVAGREAETPTHPVDGQSIHRPSWVMSYLGKGDGVHISTTAGTWTKLKSREPIVHRHMITGGGAVGMMGSK